MQQNERKGAWTLFVAILIFGALVWGYGGYERDKARKESVKVTADMPEKNTETDSLDYPKGKSESKRAKKDSKKGEKKGKRGKSKDASNEDVRDILADPIVTETK